MGVLTVPCCYADVPVVSSLALVLEYPESLWHQFFQNLVRRHRDLFGTMFGTLYGESPKCPVIENMTVNRAFLLRKMVVVWSTTIEERSTTTEASREGIQSSQTLPCSYCNAFGALRCPFFIACSFWSVWNTPHKCLEHLRKHWFHWVQ